MISNPRDSFETAQPIRSPSARAQDARAEARPRATRRRRPPKPVTSVSVLWLACTAGIVWGWLSRGESNTVPENGLGYWLGIAGLGLMALLCVYSIRKRARFARDLGPTRHWLLVHMWMGLLGPTLVIFHSNFALGSLNSQVAMFTVMIVASSGLVGRLAYTRIHHHLSGRRATLAEVRSEAESETGAMARARQAAPALVALLTEYERFALSPSRGLLRGACRLMVLRRRTREVRGDARQLLGRVYRRRRRDPDFREALRNRREALDAVDIHLQAVKRVTSFTVYERVFSLWHALHVPLCYLLFGTAAIHVVAVHMY